MQVTNEKTENRQAYLTIEMEPAELEESLEMAYRRLVKKAKIPGFRKGKAPRAVLERYLGKEGLLEDAINDWVPQAYGKAIKEQEIEAIAQPQIEVTQTDPLIFKAIVPLKPEVKLGDYRQIKAKPKPVKVTAKDVNDVLEQLRHQHATWEPVERPVEFGDLLVLNIDSKVEGEPFINREGIQYQALKDLSFPVQGFTEQLVGTKKDDEKEFKLQFPSDYPRAEMVGKEAEFKVKITEVKQEILPELNDELAKEINPDFKTLDSLRKEISSGLKYRAEEESAADFEEQVIDAVVDLAKVEFPSILVEAEINQILNQRFRGGNQELEEYLKDINKTGEELHEELHPVATKRVTRALVLGKVAEEKKIEVSDSEIDGEIQNMIKNTTEDKDKLEKVLNMPQSRQSIEQVLLTRKTLQHLVDIAKGSRKARIKTEEGGGK
ncbi:trigger factor [Chloroflexota bacterium]